MNRRITTLFCMSLFFVLASQYAQAQQRELKSGLNYTTLGKPKIEEPKEAVTAVMDGGEKNGQESTAAVVWNKYKELATGQTPEQIEKQKMLKDKKTIVTKPTAPEKPSVESVDTAKNDYAVAEKQNGFAAILSEWKNAKSSQKEMSTKSFKTPKPQETKTLSNEKAESTK